VIINNVIDYHFELLQNEIALKYIINRKISLPIVQAFKLGAGTNNYDDWFSGYITIPIFIDNIIYTIIGRSYKPELKSHKCTPDISTRLFNHSAIYNPKYLILTEGIFDALSLIQSGYNAAAICGLSNLFDEDAKSIKSRDIYLMFDNDPNLSGRKGSKRVALSILEHLPDARISICKLPNLSEKVDVNYLLMHYHRYFREYISTSLNSAERFFVENIKKNENLSPPNYENDPDRIEVIIENYLQIEMKKRNKRHTQINCPLHENDNTPSFTVYHKTNSFYCFGCGQSGGPKRLRFLLDRKLGTK